MQDITYDKVCEKVGKLFLESTLQIERCQQEIISLQNKLKDSEQARLALENEKKLKDGSTS